MPVSQGPSEYAEAKGIRPQQKRNIIQRFAFLNKYRILSQGSHFNSAEIILWELSPESQYEFFPSVETSRFYSTPRRLENFLNYKAEITIEVAWHFHWNNDLQFNEGLRKFFRGNSSIISDCRVYRGSVGTEEQ